MSATINKYTLYSSALDKRRVSVKMPKGATVLSVQVQHREVVLWALIDTTQSARETRTFALGMTGEPLDDDDVAEVNFLGTVQLAGGGFVLHVFEDIRK